MEIELKLGPLTEDQARQIFCDTSRLPGVSPARSIRMETTYYDDPAGSFGLRRQTLRLRREDGKAICTFKTALTGLARLELDCPAHTIEEGARQLAAHPDLPADARAALEQGVFVPACGARFLRQTRVCRVGDTRFDLCADVGHLFRGKAREALCEVELELLEGDPNRLQQVADQLMAAYGVTLCHRSKQQRALALGQQP